MILLSKAGNPPDRCPHCSYSEFYVSCRMSGRSGYAFQFNPTGASVTGGDNTNLHDGLNYKLGKVARCVNCDKVVGRLEE